MKYPNKVKDEIKLGATLKIFSGIPKRVAIPL